MKPQTIAISKLLSYILRHNPASVGLQLDANGWVKVHDLLTACNLHGHTFDREDLNLVVATNDKKRFEYTTDGDYIRASQGHSIAVDLAYASATPPALLYHGTADRFIESIKASGLQKRGRTHVHLSASQETASIVGRRHGKLVLLAIDAASMHNQGYEFFLSTNGVWLTDNVPAVFITFGE